MSDLISDFFDKEAIEMDARADYLREQADDLLNDSNDYNDIFVGPLLDQAYEYNVIGGIRRGIGAAAKWLGY